MSETSPTARENATTEEPRLQDALIGCAVGVLLVYAGTLIPFSILSWPVIGFGALFIVVMTGYTVALVWKRTSGFVRPAIMKARGRIRDDPQLGRLTQHPAANCWVATIGRGSGTVDIVIQGDEEPDSRLLAHARDLLVRFATLERRVDEYLAREAEREAAADPEMADEIRALRIESVHLRSPDRPRHAVIDFEGPDEMRYWYCDLVDGELSGLGFDT